MQTDPWYTRTEFWAAVVGFLQGPLVALIPGVGPIAQIASQVLTTLSPLVYIFGRGQVKVAAVTAQAAALAPALPGTK